MSRPRSPASLPLALGLLLTLSLSLGGCTVAPPADGAARSGQWLSERGLTLPAVALPAEGELSRADAVAATLSAHPALQAVYAELDIAAAGVVRAGELANPRVSLSVLRPHDGGGPELGFGVAQQLAGLLLRPARQRMAQAEYELATVELALALQELALRTESAWFESVALEQALEQQQLATRAALLAARLGERYHAAGNIDDLTLARLRDRATTAELALRGLQRERDRAQWRLARLMGAPAGHWTLPAALPLPPHVGPDADALLHTAQQQRLDLLRARQRADIHTDAAELARRWRWLGELELGLRHERESDGSRFTGPSLSLGVPLWQRNAGAVMLARAEQRLAQAELQRLERELELEVRAAVSDLEHGRALFERGHQHLLPLRDEQVLLRQERFNFMFEGPFELLAERQRALESRRDLALALGDYWRGMTALAMAVGGSVLPADAGDAPRLDLERGLPAAPRPDHHDHDHDHDHDHHDHPAGGHMPHGGHH